MQARNRTETLTNLSQNPARSRPETRFDPKSPAQLTTLCQIFVTLHSAVTKIFLRKQRE